MQTTVNGYQKYTFLGIQMRQDPEPLLLPTLSVAHTATQQSWEYSFTSSVITSQGQQLASTNQQMVSFLKCYEGLEIIKEERWDAMKSFLIIFLLK